jgi:hypothetical protein
MREGQYWAMTSRPHRKDRNTSTLVQHTHGWNQIDDSLGGQKQERQGNPAKSKTKNVPKDDPAMPMKKRQTVNPVADWTRPSRAVGIEAATKTIAMGKRAPYASQMGPISIRVKIAVPSLAIELVHTSCFDKCNVVWISRNNGDGATQMTKAKKKDIQAQWRARMCGRRQDNILISSARSPCC